MRGRQEETEKVHERRGLAVWLLERLRRTPRPQPRLALLERISLSPRQSLALIEAEGRRLLIATPHEGSPAFYALDEKAVPDQKPASVGYGAQPPAARRVSW